MLLGSVGAVVDWPEGVVVKERADGRTVPDIHDGLRKDRGRRCDADIRGVLDGVGRCDAVSDDECFHGRLGDALDCGA